jgi:hypothetical protein
MLREPRRTLNAWEFSYFQKRKSRRERLVEAICGTTQARSLNILRKHAAHTKSPLAKLVLSQCFQDSLLESGVRDRALNPLCQHMRRLFPQARVAKPFLFVALVRIGEAR